MPRPGFSYADCLAALAICSLGAVPALTIRKNTLSSWTNYKLRETAISLAVQAMAQPPAYWAATSRRDFDVQGNSVQGEGVFTLELQGGRPCTGILRYQDASGQIQELDILGPWEPMP
jgi:hypothetical protein